MLGASDDLYFANDVRAALKRSRSGSVWLLLVTVTALLGAGLAWAAAAVIEEATTGDGRVIPSRQVQVIQAFEGGIIQKILVKEGEVVEEGQVLIRIDDTGFASKLGEISQRHGALKAKIARLEAQALQLDEPAFTPEILRQAAHLADSEQALFFARKEELDQNRRVAQQRLNQRREKLVELQANEERLEDRLKFLDKELEMTDRLFKRGAIPELDLIRLQRSVSDTRGELAAVRASLPGARAAISEAESLLAAVEKAFIAETRKELATAYADISVIEQTIRAANDRVARTALRSPVRGIVNRINTTTVGAVAQSGKDIMEIVPLDDTLLIEARIRPKDVAFLHPGQQASVKITAYDYTIYGALEGKVERISADTITDEEGNKFFRVIVRTQQTMLGSPDHPLPIIPGMVASVDIQTGEKTVLDYLLKPIRKARNEALRER